MDNKTLDVVQAKKYTNKNGEEKTQWLKIGKCFTKMDLVSGIKLDVMPLPDEKGEVWLKVFPKDEKSEQQNAHTTAQGEDTLEADVPF